MNISKIEGVGAVYASKLAEQGIKTTEALLTAAAHRKGRRDLAAQTGISESLILEWVNLADLMRVRGIGQEYSDLLEAAGVDTAKELAFRRPDNLQRTLVEINEAKRLVRRVPSLSEVDGWVQQAKSLPRVVTH